MRYSEGAVHGFLALRNMEGKLLASGDLTQIVRGARVISHLVFRFRDGSLDDETAVFTDRGCFRLISDRHIQKGPQFPKPMDVTINAASGRVTVHYKDNGEDKVETERMDLPPDLANGAILDILKNIPQDAPETKLSWVAATPKPRLVKLSITPHPGEKFLIAGQPRKATRVEIKVEIGGLAGLIAPLIGKEPADTNVWISAGDVPTFVKSEGTQFLGGPLWRIEMTSPVWPQSPR